jgi:hypothetical protein
MNKDWDWNTNNKEGQTIIFEGGEREKKCFIVQRAWHLSCVQKSAL